MGSKSNDFCPIRGECLLDAQEEGHVEAGQRRGQAARPRNTGSHRKLVDAGRDSPLQTWEEVWPTDPWILDLQLSQL